LLTTYRTLHDQDRGTYRLDVAAMARRALKNVCLDYLMRIDDAAARTLCLEQFRAADNMTDQFGALTALADSTGPERGEALAAFYQRWQGDALVVDKWLSLQATASRPGTLAAVKDLMAHEAFSLRNPNKVRALIGAFCQANPLHFHAADGEGYTFFADQVLALNVLNPQIAARLMTALSRWRRFDTVRQDKMRGQLERILASPQLSPDVYEIAFKTLEKA
ncbi:MAG: aminopeptidase N C-terminal domain-containing protein, partial [Candidatus Competibacter denitrificans]